MTLEDFQKFIDEQDELLRVMKGADYSERERVFARTIKLGEEYGELCDAVLASVGDQRKGKLTDGKAGNLEGEFADVLIVTFLLAKVMGVDVMPALAAKIEKIKEKHNKEL
ncbi:MAG: MazG nucleotide pyrophosphohydrolase domain-containing protein [Candidatus Moraniibacteriota bacterium]